MKAKVAKTFTEKLAHNAETTFRSGSTYVALAIATAVGLYNSLDETQREAILGAFPFLSGWGGVITAVAAFLATKLKPSDSVSTQTASLLEEVARLRLNEYLRSKGVAVVPAPVAPPPPAPAPVPIVDFEETTLAALPEPPAPSADPLLDTMRAAYPHRSVEELQRALAFLRTGRDRARVDMRLP